MYPDYTTPEQKKTKQIIISLCVALCLLILVVLAFTLRPTEAFQQGWLHKTAFRADQNFTHLNGSKLYGYNGLAFYAASKDGKISVLNAKYRLPKPDKIFWADEKGALLTFNASFYYSRIETELKKFGKDVNYATAQEYTWYLDFATSTLRIATPAQANLAHYSAKDHGFYYFIDMDSTPQLHFYDITSYRDRILADMPTVTDLNSLTNCTGTIACFIARDKNVPAAARLYQVKSDGSITQIYDSKGRMFPTNDPDKYVVVETTPSNSADSNYDDADFPDTPAYLYDLKTKSLRGLGFDVGPDPVSLHMVGDNEFYAFSDTFITSYRDQRDVPAYLAGRFKSRGDAKTALMPLLFSNETAATDLKFVPQSTQSSDEIALLSAANQQQYLFDFNKSTKDIVATSAGSADTTVKNCIKNAGLASRDYYPEENLFRIIFKTQPDFQKKIAVFDTCLTTTGTPPVLGYSYDFVGIDPTYDRIVTD